MLTQPTRMRWGRKRPRYGTAWRRRKQFLKRFGIEEVAISKSEMVTVKDGSYPPWPVGSVIKANYIEWKWKWRPKFLATRRSR